MVFHIFTFHFTIDILHRSPSLCVAGLRLPVYKALSCKAPVLPAATSSAAEPKPSDIDISDLGSRNYAARSDFYCLVAEDIWFTLLSKTRRSVEIAVGTSFLCFLHCVANCFHSVQCVIKISVLLSVSTCHRWFLAFLHFILMCNILCEKLSEVFQGSKCN